jgi:WD40 repeat protein
MLHTRVPTVQSLCLNPDGTRLLVGTRGGDITEINMESNTLLHDRQLVTGHCFGELWGLASHPLLNAVFATSGDDKTVRMWHIGAKECTAMTKSDALPDMSRALIFEPTKGNFLVAGLGGRLGGRKVGKFGKHAGKIVTLDTKSLTMLAQLKVAKEQIADLAFTSDGKTLAVASNDQFIYLCAVNGPTDIHKRSKCGGHSSFVTDISLSEDNQWMMTNDGAGEILFWNVDTGDREPDADAVRACSWAPNTCPMSWESVGIWPNDGDLTDINAMEVSEELGMIVTADDYGTVKSFNGPSTSFSAPYMAHVGHSAHVTNISFNCDHSRVISVGGNDRCAMVWRVVETRKGGGKGQGSKAGMVVALKKKKKKVMSVGDDHLDEEGEVEERTARQVKEKEKPKGPPPPVLGEEGEPLDPTMTVVGRFVKPKRHKKHYMQTKTWVSVAKRSKPDDAVDEGRKPMDRCLNLEHVHGFR